MKQAFTLVATFIYFFVISLTHAYTEVNTILDCSNCIVAQNKNVCREEKNERIAYCCEQGEQSRGCVGRDFCSQDALTISMRMTSCPFVQRACGSTSQIVVRPNITEQIINSQSSNRLFNHSAICHYRVTADLSQLTPAQQRLALINVHVQQYQNVYVHLNNGTSMKNANDPIEVNAFNTGVNFTYTARNNIVFLVLAGTNFTNMQPSVNIQLRLLIQNEVKETTVVTAPTIVTPIIINKTVYNVTFKNVSFFTEKSRPQFQNYTLMAAILLGIILFAFVDCVTSKSEQTKDFDILEDFQFSARVDEFQSNRQFLTAAHSDHQNHDTNQEFLDNSLKHPHQGGGHHSINSMGSNNFQFFKRPLPTVRVNQSIDNEDSGVEMMQMAKKPDFRFVGKVVPSEMLSNGGLSIREKSFEKEPGGFMNSGRTSRNRVLPMSVVQQQQRESQQSSQMSQYRSQSQVMMGYNYQTRNTNQSIDQSQNQNFHTTRDQNSSSILGPLP